MIDYKKIGLKAGLEIHLQLDTKEKLFCGCSTQQQEKEPLAIVERKLQAVASELGEVDVAAQYEYLRDRKFYYQVFKNESCAVELDEEPPHPLNQEALQIALQVALLLNCKIPDEIHVMRKTVVDGSNTSGFQRTLIVGKEGWLDYKGRKIPVEHVCLEEDAAALVKEENGKVFYRLNRLGIPLVEIATGLLQDFSPQEIQDVAWSIGLICLSTGKIKRGAGAIRQDINVSIKKGARVEIKGIPSLSLLSKVVETEVQRQLSLLEKGKKVEEETRAALPDGTTRFTRPLPGSARMYPETDLAPIRVDKKLLLQLKRKLPELPSKKMRRYKKLGLSEELALQVLQSPYSSTIEKLFSVCKKLEPSLIAGFFISTLKDLERRERIPVENLEERHFLSTFKLLEKKKIAKEALPLILSFLSRNPKEEPERVVEKLELSILSPQKIETVAEEILKANPHLPKEKLVGLTMKKVRGRASFEIVSKVVEEKLRKKAMV